MVPRQSLVWAGALAVGLSLAGGPVSAKVTVTIDRNPIGVGERTVLAVIVEGQALSEPELPQFDRTALTVGFAGTRQDMQFSKGKRTSSVTYQYVLVARRAGRFPIGAVSVPFTDGVQKSRAFVLTVTESAPAAKPSDDVFISASVSNASPFVGEQVVYSLKVFSGVNLQGGNLTWPTFDGFVAKDMGEKPVYQTTVRGRQYNVNEFRQALFPVQAGALELAGCTLAAQIAHRGRGFFASTRIEERSLRSAKVAVNVRTRPAEPPDFSGLVGSFDLKVQLTRDRLSVGESTTMVMTVSGVGNVFAIAAPVVRGLKRFKVYDDKTQSSTKMIAAGLSGTTIFRKSLVPLEHGTATIPRVTLRYFDPEKATYRLVSRGPFTLEVGASVGGESLQLTESVGGGTKTAVRVLGEDIVPLYTELDALAPRTIGGMSNWVLGGSLSPALLFLILAYRLRRQRAEAGDSGLRRRRRALVTALKAQRRLKPTSTAEDAARILRAFIGDHFELEGAALTAAEVRSLLRQAAVDARLEERTVDTLRRYEASLYGAVGVEAVTGEDMAAELKPLLRQLDAALVRRPL